MSIIYGLSNYKNDIMKDNAHYFKEKSIKKEGT